MSDARERRYARVSDQTAGMHTLLAVFLGFVIIGFFVLIAGVAISVKGIRAIAKDSLTPQRTIQTVTGGEAPSPDGKEPSAAELHGEALATKHRIGEEGEELKHRMTPSELEKRAIEHLSRHPLSWGTVLLAGAMTGGYFVGRKFWRA